MCSSPDVETSGEVYADRFSGDLGRYFLSVQEETIASFLKDFEGKPLRVLDVGGGHCQVTPLLLRMGFEVWVHGSTEACGARVRGLMASGAERLHFFTSPLFALPFDNDHFDVVIGIRLLAHVENAQRLVDELTRVSRRFVIVDYAPTRSFNIFYPLFFQLKRMIEKDTRPFSRFSDSAIENAFASSGFKHVKAKRQFFLPMGLHRLGRMPRISKRLEGAFATIGLTRVFGSPVISLAESLEIFLL